MLPIRKDKSPGRGVRALLLLGALVFPGAPASAQDEPSEEILKLALEMAERDHPELDEAKVRSEIERMATVYRELLGTEPTPAQRADAFRRLLFEREKFESVADLESSRTLHIDTVLERRKGYCLSLGVVALAVAERVGEPLYGVAAPNHFFVRFDDGTYRRNLELTRKGVEITDAEYQKRIGDSLPKDTIYMRNLTTKGVRACLLHNRGYVAMAEGRLHYANRDLRRAARLGLGEAYRTLGVLYGEQKKWGQAKSYFIRALGLYPDDVDALINLAICRHALGEFNAALQDIEMVLVMKPGHQRALKLLTDWKEEKDAQPKQGKPREAMPAKPAGLKPGLRGRYFAGTWFEKQITERVDRTIDFDWQNSSPAPGVPRDRFSVRWEGYLKAPRTGTYTFFLAANDGCRLRLGQTLVLQNWRDMRYQNWYGSKDVQLEVGWHRISIEHYDARGGARIILRIGVEGEAQPLPLAEHLFHKPVQAKDAPRPAK